MSNESNMPTLSIVTPTYNRGELLKRCFVSLLKQSDQDFEWIIVDDGSTDNTEEVVNGFTADFPVKYVKKENGGKHTALNKSHAYIQGKYVVILDSDDYLYPNTIELLVDAATAEEAELVIFGFCYFFIFLAPIL